MQHLTNGEAVVEADGTRVSEVIDSLEARFPGIRERLQEGEGLRPGLSVVVDAQVSHLGLLESVSPESEVHFLPAIGGG
jgi:molybdopterin synthase sulfur carrier subunit